MLRFIFPPRFAFRAVAFAVLAGLCWALFSPQRSAAQLKVQTTTPKTSNWSLSPGEDVFILYQNERGETTCRPATKAERDQINSGRSGGPARVIYPGAPRERDGANAMSTLESETGLNLLPSAGLRIVLHGTTQLDNTPAAKNAFIVAANRWE